MSKIVLCVDDSVTMQQVADISLRGSEFTYVGARSYDDGLDKAKSQRPTVILVDSVMPGKSGYDLCLALKSDTATANVPVVILFGNGAPFDATRGQQVGADASFQKPWDTQTMLDKIVDVLAKAANGVARPGSGTAASAPQATPAAPAAPPAAPKTVTPAAASAAAAMPPRSATIMGMPTVKMPAGAPQPAKTAIMAVPPIAPDGANSGYRAPAPQMTTPGTSTGLRAPAPPKVNNDAPPAAAAAPALAIAGGQRAPMISGTPTKRSALVERTLAKMAARLAEAAGIEPGSPELLALLKLSTEVVERIVWEVVPDLAEQIIRENLAELTARRS